MFNMEWKDDVRLVIHVLQTRLESEHRCVENLGKFLAHRCFYDHVASLLPTRGVMRCSWKVGRLLKSFGILSTTHDIGLLLAQDSVVLIFVVGCGVH